MGISHHTERRIKEAARIEEVVGDFVDLKKSGIRYLGLCPFHEDHNLGSFVVYPPKNMFRCFACGESGDSVSFIMKHEALSYPDALRWLGKKYHIYTDMENFVYTSPPPRPTPPPKPMLTLPKVLVDMYHGNLRGDTLVRWLYTGIAWDRSQLQRIEEVLAAYKVGRAKNGMTVFWQIDENHAVHTGKMMRYRPDGHRERDGRYNFDWVHKALERSGNTVLYNPAKQQPAPTLFGMHLLDQYPGAPVHIVESEKTALLMAIAYSNGPSHIWMACGGLEMLSRQRLAPIMQRYRRVVLYPDRDGIDKWRAKAANLHYDLTTVDTDPVTRWWCEADGPKADIADVVVRLTNDHRRENNDEYIRQLMQRLDLLPNTPTTT